MQVELYEYKLRINSVNISYSASSAPVVVWKLFINMAVAVPLG
jgi:hypothetical protein